MKRFGIARLDHLRRDDFVRHNAIMFVGSMVVAATNYLYYPVVGRLVSTSQFGEVQTLVSLFLEITLVLGVVTDVTVNVVTNADNHDERNRLVYELERLVTLAMAVVVGVAFIFIEPISHFLRFTSVWPLVILGVVLVIGALASQRSAFLRGVRAFGSLSISQFLSAAVRLVSSLVLVLVGFGTNGAIGGLVVAQLVTVLYLWRLTHRKGLHPSPNDRWLRLPDMRIIRPELPFAALVLIVSVVTTVFFSIDVVLVKHYFSSQVAGEYAGIATIGRIIYFLTGSVATVLLSAIQLKASVKQNRRLFLRSLVLTSILGGAGLVAFWVAPRFFIELLIGRRYLPLAGLLPRLSLTLFVISIVNLVFSYDVALRRWSIAVISVIGMVGTALFVGFHHGSPSQLVNALLAGALLLLVLRAADSFRRNILHFGPGKPQLPL